MTSGDVAASRLRSFVLGPVRAAWIARLMQWQSAGVLPFDVTQCLSVQEVQIRQRQHVGQACIIVDSGLPFLERDLIASARNTGTAVVLIGEPPDADNTARPPSPRDATYSLSSQFTLDDVIEMHRSLSQLTVAPIADTTSIQRPSLVISVCGSGGTGTSLFAAMIAQGVVALSATPVATLLADFALNAEQGMLHDVTEMIPCADDVIDAVRKRTCSADELRSSSFYIASRGYRLLLGSRPKKRWAEPSVDECGRVLLALRNTFDVIVCDITADFAREATTGSADLEERNARNIAGVVGADLIVVTSHADAKGVHATSEILDDLHSLGVSAQRIVVLFTRTPKSGSTKSELTKALSSLASFPLTNPPLFSPTIPAESAIRDGLPFPSSPCVSLARALRLMAIDHAGIDVERVLPIAGTSRRFWQRKSA